MKSREKKNGRRQQPATSEGARKNGQGVHVPERQEQLLHVQVRAFAAAGWKPDATDTNNGVTWRWYREGAKYVVAGRIGNADIIGRFSPADVLRIRAAT